MQPNQLRRAEPSPEVPSLETLPSLASRSFMKDMAEPGLEGVSWETWQSLVARELNGRHGRAKPRARLMGDMAEPILGELHKKKNGRA
ncbi:hypothetical protein RHMOL_Rhmol03G0049400 [Rhododendron molle]|uniref:Uncharacterized protein n=1 Tax=Rhododendron molle TaxID=49168 RepID=A0ACC0PAG2_RHOML|nr:hypothetical protein RHMOL_Rhmol03G0049400 [Rhododendron molle]